MLTIKIDPHPMPSHHLHQRHLSPDPQHLLSGALQSLPRDPCFHFCPYSPSSTQKPKDPWETQGKSLLYSKQA